MQRLVGCLPQDPVKELRQVYKDAVNRLDKLMGPEKSKQVGSPVCSFSVDSVWMFQGWWHKGGGRDGGGGSQIYAVRILCRAVSSCMAVF